MKTVLTKSAIDAARYIIRGGIVAFPTETVYGLGANVFDEAALAQSVEAKRRPADNPLIAHIADLAQIRELSTAVNNNARSFIDVFFPGPLTLVLGKSAKVPLIATAGLDTIGIRMPGLVLTRRFLMACGVPIAAPSANLSGKPSPTTWEAVIEDLDGRIDCILQGPESEIGVESTVVDCTADIPLVLRSGSISLEQLRVVVPSTKNNDEDENVAPKSPGLRHRHYSPRARVVLNDQKEEFGDHSNAAYIGLSHPPMRFAHEKYCSNVEEYAHALFEFFRECDRSNIGTIYCEPVAEQGIGAAVMDRLRRAARR